MRRVFLLVVDGLGVGYAHDGRYPEDIGANTLLHVLDETKCYLPTFEKLGLLSLPTIDEKVNSSITADYGIISPASVGKDSCVGHWEMAGYANKIKYDNFMKGFPDEITDIICTAFGCDQVLINREYDDNRAITDYGDRHIATGFPIVYASGESCLTIACHGAVFSTEELHYACEYIYGHLPEKYKLLRLVARPFAGIHDHYYYTKARRDYVFDLPRNPLPQVLQNKGLTVIGVGKIPDLFCNVGFDTIYTAYDNMQVAGALTEIADLDFDGLCFANFADGDVLYGHRNDSFGFKECLYQIDNFLEDFIPKLKDEDTLIITADHGNDPLNFDGEHTHEMLPVLVYQPHMSRGKYLGEFNSLTVISDFIKKYFYISKKSELQDKIDSTRE